jgi:PAS domain S-box-containing protein
MDMAPETELRILIAEGEPADAELVQDTLREGGLKFSAEIVATRRAFAEALDRFKPDIVLSDHNLPDFDGLSALGLVRAKHQYLPVIEIAGFIEEAAIDLIKAGASDYVLKDRLARLPTAVRRAMAEAQEQRERDAGEEALHESAENLAEAQRIAEVGSWEWIPERSVTVWSAEMSRIFGRDPSRPPATFEEFLAYVHPDDKSLVMDAMDRAMKANVPFHTEIRIIRSDGGTRTLDTRGVVSESKNGGPSRLTGTVHDITDRKAMETALRDSEKAHRELFELSPDAIVAWNGNAIIEAANKAAATMLGYDDAEAMIGKSWLDFVLPQDVPARAEATRRAERSGGAFDAEFNMQRKDGSRFFVEGRLRAALDSAGNPVRTIAIARDVTERKRAEEAIYLSEARFRTAFESVGNGMALVDLYGRFLKINAAFCRIVGYSEDEMLARSFQDLTHPDDLAECADVAVRMRKGELSSYEMDKRYIRKDGGIVWVQLDVSTLHDAAGAPLHYVTQVQDITDRVTALSRLLQLNRTLRTLSAGNSSLVRATTEQELLNEMCRVCVEVGGYRLVSIGFVEHDEAKSGRPVAWAGEHAEYLQKANITWADTERGRGPTGTAVRTGQTQISQNIETDPAMAPWRAELLGYGFKSSVALPLKSGSDVVGAMTLFAGEPDAFRPEEVDLLEELADDLAYGVHSRRDHAGRETAVSALDEALKSTVQAVANAVEMRDGYTAGHQRQVAELAVAIARELGLTEWQIEGLFLAGTIHDVGKLSVPAEFLSKPGKLTALEYEVIQTHVQSGYDIIKGVNFPWPIAQIILQHHERLDGSGYPNHLNGEAIPIEGRIMAVADVVDAMQARRPYRPALGLDAALAEIEAGRGRLYDPTVVDACVTLFRQKGFTFH